jgi:hypothetical protein
LLKFAVLPLGFSMNGAGRFSTVSAANFTRLAGLRCLSKRGRRPSTTFLTAAVVIAGASPSVMAIATVRSVSFRVGRRTDAVSAKD